MVTVDVAVFARRGRQLEVALIERRHEPFAGAWAFPGGFIEMDERLADSAQRELVEETGMRAEWLAPACFAGDPGRDPRGRTVSAVFYTLLPERPEARAGDDAAQVAWFPITEPPPMAFDHGDVLAAVLRQLAKDALTSPVVFSAVPADFTERDFAEACAAVPALAWLEPHARMVLASLVGRGLVSRIDTAAEEPDLYRLDREAWGEGPRPWTTWFGALGGG